MAAPEVAPRPVDTTGDDPDLVHVYCVQHTITWCGLDAARFTNAAAARMDDVCRVCLLAYEMGGSEICPVCGRADCD